MISRETIRGGFPIKGLGEVAEFLDNQRRPITASDRIPGPYPYYGANGQQDSVANYIFDEPLILLAEDGGLFDEPDRGIAYAIEGKTWVNNHAHVLRVRDDVQQEYLVRVLENYDVTPWITGSTRAKLTKAGASKIQIPLPPLAEQKRIAGILDAADALRAKRRESLAQLDTLLQSTFLEMFGDPVTNPMGWEVEPLGDVLNPTRPVSYGILKPGDYQEDGVIMLRIQDIRGGGVRDNDLHRVPNKLSEQYKRTLLSGDEIVISLVGTIGLCALIPRRYAGANVHRNLAVVVPGGAVQPVFLLHHMLSAHFQYQIIETTKGGIQKLLNLGDLKRLPVPLPPLDLQHRFAAIVESVEQQKASRRAHLDELDTLFASLQSCAFQGEL